MVALVNKESHWANFYIKRFEWVFLKFISIVEESKHSILNLNLASIKVGANIYKNVIKIMGELFPLVEVASNLDIGYASKCQEILMIFGDKSLY